MKTKEMIEMLTCWSNDCHVWFDFDGHKASAAILLREAAHKLRENAIQEYEIETLKKLIGELRKELAEREVAPGWISVEERMPFAEYGESDNVLAMCAVGVIYMLYFDGSNWCYPAGDPYCAENKESKITHWMPLPKPPKPPKKVKTYKDVFLEKFPKAPVNKNNIPTFCIGCVFPQVQDIKEMDCDWEHEKCWNKPYFEEEGEAE